ncbi:MAG: quinolinate synthase NadA [Candidatus Pacebacteria bacterium]|nr:quinolinate synthase NadA [Candidatus Paceibacterota bacterium]
MNDLNLVEKIEKLKKKRNAVILAHNYQLPEVQDIADFVGDSLELAQISAKTDAEVVVLCGVYFMAETAAITNPKKKILIPDATAGCPMADMIDARKVRELKKQYPDATVVCYVNSTIEVKAESDICCTSSNALKVIESLKDHRQIIFVPDKYLGSFLSLSSDKEFILANGYCPTHAKISPRLIDELKVKYKNAEVLVHGECAPEVKEKADKILSTGQMCNYVKNSSKKDFIIGTEIEMLYRLRKENPEKNLIQASPLAICPDMKKNNLEKILNVLENMKNEVKVDEKVRLKARKCIDRMLLVK